MIHRACILTLVLSMSTLPSLALAQDTTEVSKEDAAQAQKLFDQGVADYSARRYDKASLGFQKAYALLPEATFLYNTAKALQKLGSYDQALAYAKRAKAQKKRPLPQELVLRVNPLIVELEKQWAQKKLKQKQEEDARLASLKASKPKPLFTWRGWTGIGLLTAGALSGGASFFFSQQAASTQDELTPPYSFSEERYNTLQSDFDSQRQLGQITLYAAAGLAAAGTGFLVWDLMREGETSQPTLKATLSPNGVQVLGSW